jgi:hypothetical protein
MAGTFVIAQGGGPTAVINQTMVGAALEIRKRHPGAKVLGSTTACAAFVTATMSISPPLPRIGCG